MEGKTVGAPLAASWPRSWSTCCRSSRMIDWYCTTCWSISTTFCTTLVLISLARLAYLSELTVSSY